MNSANPSATPKRFALVAGEASGDLLGAGLIAALRERYPDATFAGVGGPRMVAAGFEAWHASDELAVMGLVEVLKHLPRLLALRRDVRKRVLAFKPDAFIGIDAPDFNFGLERKLKTAGLRTVHYVSPSIWAWRAKRARTIGRSADLVLCLFPFEPDIYAQRGVRGAFVGHPLADAFPLDPQQGAARATLGLPENAPVLALLPGSRLGEVRRLSAEFIGAARWLRERLPDLQIVAPMANEACRSMFEAALASNGSHTENAAEPANHDSPFAVRVIDGHAHEAMIAADAILLASGTATLEAMLAKRPMVVAYRLSPLTYRIVTGLKLLKTNRYALPNVLAGRDLVPELMQDAGTPQALAEYRHLHLMLRRDASRSAAAAIADLLAAGA